MLRGMALAGAVALLVVGRVARADDAAPVAPPAGAGGAVPSRVAVPPPPPPPPPPALPARARAAPLSPPLPAADPYAPPAASPRVAAVNPYAAPPPIPPRPTADPYAPPPAALAGATPSEAATAIAAAGEAGVTEDMVLRSIQPGATERRVNPWTGSVSLRYRLRTTDDPASAWDTDQDLYAYLRLKYRDEELPGFSGSFHGRVTADLDDFGNVNGYYAFDSITDTYDSRFDGRVYHAYVNYTVCNSPFKSVRAGRMWTDVGEYITFDGVRVESARTPWGCIGLAAFAGMPTYLFDETLTGDFVGGLQLFGQPWNGSEWELDWTYVNSENVYGEVEDNLFNLVWNQRLGNASLVRLEYQHLDEDPRLFRALVDAVWPEHDIVVRGYFNTLITAQEQQVYDFDYYFWTMLAMEPYWDANVSASKAIGECFDAEAGFTIRRLYDQADQGTYNREWEQYFAGISTYDWMMQGLSLTLTGEWWNSTSDFGTAVFDIEYRPSRAWRFVLGTDFAAYRYDIFADQERVNLYSAYGRVRWRPSQRWLFDLRLRLENDDFGTYTRLDALAQYNF